MADDDELLRVVDRARQLHAALDVARLERMRFIYRSWIASPASVEGGFSLTRDELECVLEYPSQRDHVDFLMDTFRADDGPNASPRIDLLTLLAACACLARGPLEAKAKFLFTLVDFDTEDEIVEDELAMLIALCNDGLRRLRVIVTELTDMDARAIACEAFEFVDVEDGGKMTLSLFVRWLVSHWRPAALFDRIQSLFLVSQLVQRLHRALRQRLEATVASPLCSQLPSSLSASQSTVRTSHGDDTALATSSVNETAPPNANHRVSILTGPIIGLTSTQSAAILIESGEAGTIDIRLTDRLTNETHTSSHKLRRKRPTRCIINNLAPGRVYNITLAGVPSEASGYLQTLSRGPASLRILVLADDLFCDLPVTRRSGLVHSSATCQIGNIREYLIHDTNNSGTAIMYDMAIHVGSMPTLQKQLIHGYKMLHNRLANSSTECVELEEMVRRCYRSYTALPDVRSLRLSGPNWFSSVGIARGLVEREASVDLLRAVKKVVQEYEDLNMTLDRHESQLVHKFADQVTLVNLDTTDCIINNSTSEFILWPESLLTARQILALNYALAECWWQKLPSVSSISRQVILLCDSPFVWPFTNDTKRRGNGYIDKVRQVASDPWSFYSNDLRHLLSMLFQAVTKDPLLRITLLCKGWFASRVVIVDRPTGRSIEQLSLGPLSNVENVPPVTARFDPEHSQSIVGEDYSISGHAIAGTSMSLKQYCLIDIVPHIEGAVCSHVFYTAGRPEARIVLGPIIGRVTTRTARILIEIDRPVQNVSCVLSSREHSSSVECEVQAFVPTIFKLEGLHPGTRYKVKFEGLLKDPNDIEAYVETPALLPLSVEWLVFSRNNLRHFLPLSSNSENGSRDKSHWHRILSPETRSRNTKFASIVSNRNNDKLGESTDQQSEQFNPWYHVETFRLSEPLRQPHLSVHVGGQVDLSEAFANDELCRLITQLCDSTIGELRKNEIYSSIRFCLQEVYRTAWGTEPMRTILGYSSNVMLLHDQTDLFFSSSRILECMARSAATNDALGEDRVGQVAMRLRAIAFELWQLYQNQLSVDVSESDLDNSRRNSSKFASHLTLGMCRLLFVNVSDDMRHSYNNQSKDELENDHKRTQASEQVVPLVIPGADANTQLTLFSLATWKTIDEALDIASIETVTAQKAARSKPKHASAIKQLVVFLPVDLIEIVSVFPAVRPEVVQVFEKLFQWKMAARAERSVTLVMASENSSSLCFKVTDEKVNETLEMTRISSISQLKEMQSTKAAKAKNNKTSKDAATTRGYFSKRFTYESALLASGSGPVPTGFRCRSYAHYMFLSDYRHGFLNESVLCFPSRGLPKIRLGPVIGRFVRCEKDLPTPDQAEDTVLITTFSVPILVEIDSPAKLTCVVVDSMVNSETRVTRELQANQPTVFCIHGLAPLRRYVYFFESVANGDSRRGCFHTPPSDRRGLNLVAVSSNFPTQMDEEQDSLWVPLLERVKLPWCGLDAILHLGGQVPLHEAAVECLEWTLRELQREILHGDPKEVKAKRIQHVRARVRQRFQQEYYICWNLPHVRELLARVSHWFVQSKADVAPFFGRESLGPPEASLATRLVVEVAKEVVREYQIQLTTAIGGDQRTTSEKQKVLATQVEESQRTEPSVTRSEVIQDVPTPLSDNPTLELETEHRSVDEVGEVDNNNVDAAEGEIADTGGALSWQHEGIVWFVCDIRSTGMDESEQEPITCNGRLSRPLSRQENPIMGEKQWRYFESILKKKRTHLLVLCMELPLILTNATHVEKLRDELRPNSGQGSQWKLYDHSHVLQHWVACKRQLEQLLLILFKWKAKRSGRDVLILSGGMRIGIDTMLQDRETKLSLRNFTVGPVTANVEPFEFPLSGVACATFGGGIQDDHFTFHHSLLAKKNYLLLQVSVDQPADAEAASSNVVADFVPNEGAALSRLHPVNKFQRFPLWWTNYVPMGKAVFWDDTITMKSETDERMLALWDYVWHDRGFSGALEVFYEKYQFAETARMEDLRSRHLQHVDLKANFLAVLNDLWRAIPESKRQQMAYFLDPFVVDMLMDHVAPDLLTKRLESGEPIELAYFSRVIRDFVFDACLLRLTIVTQQEDEDRARKAAAEKRKHDAKQAALEKENAEQAAKQEEERMAELLRTDPLQYATIKLAQEEAESREKLARHQEKLDRKKAERLAELEEEQAIAKEQRKLNKLAERDADEYERRQHELDIRIRKLEEKRAQRAAQKKAAAEKAAREASSDQISHVHNRGR